MGILARLALLALDILGIKETLELLGIKLDSTAIEDTPKRIQGQVDWIGEQLTLADTGLSAISAKCSTIIAALDGINAPVLEAIAALPAGSDIVIPTSSQNAAGVWAYQIPGLSTILTGTLLHYAGIFGWHAGDVMLPRMQQAPWIGYRANLWDHVQAHPTGSIVQPDWSDIQAADTRLSWVQRTASNRTWYEEADTGIVWCLYNEISGQGERLILLLTEAEFQAQKQLAATIGPPIWPGLAGVVLGTPVGISEPTIIAGPMDGILITLDTANPGAGQWAVGAFTSWRYAGYVVFLSAEGHADTTQFLGPADNVFCPKGMTHADSCVVYLNKIATATVTPWTLA